ncbi:MAG: hypothetical protein WDW36_001947 [Sanguina aurantia]
MEAALSVPRLQPLLEKVFIAVSREHHAEVAAWAGHVGLPLENVLLAPPGPGGRQSGTLDAAAHCVSTLNITDHLLLVEVDHLAEPGLSLKGLLEHALVRGKDSLASCTSAPGEPAVGRAALIMQGDGGGFGCSSRNSPKVASIQLCVDGTEGDAVSLSANLCFLQRSTLPLLLQACSTAPPPTSGIAHLPYLFSQLLQQGRPVYSLPLQVSMPLGRGREALTHANAFYAAVAREACAGPPGEAAISLAQVMARVGAPPAMPPAFLDASALAGDQPMRQAFLRFHSAWLEKLAAFPAGPAGAPGPGALHSTLPARFADHTTRRHNPAFQHPVFTTTASDYGNKPVSAASMPDVYAGTCGMFTKGFTGMNRDGSLHTAVRKSKVHQLLDEF